MSKSASDDHGKKWVAPRSGGYSAKSAVSGRFMDKKDVTGRISKKTLPPPGGGSVAKAK
jgi:hypothetical protein